MGSGEEFGQGGRNQRTWDVVQTDIDEELMQVMTMQEIQEVSGGEVTTSEVLLAGAAITAAGALALAASPIFAAAAVTYAATSAVMGVTAAVLALYD